MTNPTLLANLRAELARAELSQAAVAELIDVTPGQVTGRMTGRIRWQLHELQAVARRLDIPITRLIDDTPVDDSAVAS